MKKLSEFSRELPFYFFVAGVFLIIVSKDLLSNGMFMDGVIYSTISRNLADGSGTFWNPHFSATMMPDFHDHPPLALGIQSLFYMVFGESRYIDKLYSFLTIVITGFVILKIWRCLGYKHGWVPLFFWLITPSVIWSSSNNVLENTLTIFTSLSVLFYLKYLDGKKYFYILFSGIMLSLGFLTKGFVAFFPWTLPFLMWLALRKYSLGKMLIYSTEIIIFTLVPLLILILFSPVARLSLNTYIDRQVVNSIKNVVTVGSRFYILKRLISDLIPLICFCLVILVWVSIRKLPFNSFKYNSKAAMVFFLLGLSGVLPIMISMKQSGFYNLPTFPFFAIGAGIFLNSIFKYFAENLNYESKGFLVFRWIGYGFIFLGIILSLGFSDKYSRDKGKIKDVYTIIPEISWGSIININPDMYVDWSLHGYFARFKNISLDPDVKNNREYLLIKNEYYSDTLNRNYEIVKLNTKNYELFRKR